MDGGVPISADLASWVRVIGRSGLRRVCSCARADHFFPLPAWSPLCADFCDVLSGSNCPAILCRFGPRRMAVLPVQTLWVLPVTMCWDEGACGFDKGARMAFKKKIIIFKRFTTPEIK